MDGRPAQRPEGRLIAAALKRTRTSQRKAARAADISENRLRAIISGYQTVSAGITAPVTAPAETLARIARAVGVTAPELEDADRADAADELRELETVTDNQTGEQPSFPLDPNDPAEADIWHLRRLPAMEREGIILWRRDWLRRGGGSGRNTA